MLQLHTLGGGGYIPNERRETSAFLVIAGNEAILLDLGTGISHLLQPYYQELLKSMSRLSILISHYHLDHLVGLTWLPKFCKIDTRIFAPAPPLLEGNPSQALGIITAPPFFSLPIQSYPFEVQITNFSSSELTVGGIAVKVLAQEHSGGSVGYRLGDSIAYVTDTDTTNSDRHVDFTSGVHTIITDTMYDSSHYERLRETTFKPLDHGYSIGAGELASRAGAESLVLMHISPDYDEARVAHLTQEAEQAFANTALAEDCTCTSIP